MKLNEYLAKNAVKLMIKGSGEKNPTRQTNDLGMYDYVENLESVLGKMVWMNGAAMIARMIILVNCTKMERYLWSRLLVNFSRANILVQAAQPMYLTMVYHITHMGIVSRTTPLRLAAPL